MRPRTVKISAKLMGMVLPIGEVKIAKFAEVRQAETKLLCPACSTEPAWQGGYHCPCGATYNHWSKLKRVLASTGEPVVKEKFTDGKSDVVADAYVMDEQVFAQYADATADEYGITVADATSARNLKKLLVAIKKLSKVIIILFRDTYEERVAVLTTSISNRVILREIIPLNLADITETMTANMNDLTPQDIAEAEAFTKMLPTATEEQLYAHDYRVVGLGAATLTEKVSPKVMELEAILARVPKS